MADVSQTRGAWLSRLDQLVNQVEQWAQSVGWSTRRLEKKLDDLVIGEHRVPVLLLQEGISRILLEPIGRSSPGTEGIVDLYLMPAYDDIASFYYYDGRWNLHYRFAGANAAAPDVADAKGQPLSKDVLEKALADLRQHAA
jgi:hypothetical protein